MVVARHGSYVEGRLIREPIKFCRRRKRRRKEVMLRQVRRHTMTLRPNVAAAAPAPAEWKRHAQNDAQFTFVLSLRGEILPGAAMVISPVQSSRGVW